MDNQKIYLIVAIAVIAAMIAGFLFYGWSVHDATDTPPLPNQY